MVLDNNNWMPWTRKTFGVEKFKMQTFVGDDQLFEN